MNTLTHMLYQELVKKEKYSDCFALEQHYLQ